MDSHKLVIQEWLTKSDNDFRNLEAFFQEHQPYQIDLACFCAQQCIEKLLKAVLILHKQKFVKIHDLDVLAEKVKEFVPEWQPNWIALERLATVGIAARYPGVTVSIEDLKEAYELCTKIRAELLPLFQTIL